MINSVQYPNLISEVEIFPLSTVPFATSTDLVYFGAEVIKRMEEVLAYTPELLPVLKEAGVVDSGGSGLVEIVKGAYDAMLGKEASYGEEIVEVENSVQPVSGEEPLVSAVDVAKGLPRLYLCRFRSRSRL